MSHVDEGMLHAYLDGGLSALDAVRVERHVADCGACRQQLDQARALIQRAARLLEWASPPADRAAPPLADLRPAVPARWRVPVAWAATIVIALGAGIYGGQIILSRSPDADTAAARDEEVASRDGRAAPITVLADTTAARRPAEAKTATGGLANRLFERDTTAALNQPAQVAAAQTQPDTATARAQRKIDSAGALAVGARNEAEVTSAATPAADTFAAGRERRQLGLAPGVVAAAPEPQVRVDGVPISAARARRVSAYTTWPVITRDSAARLLQTGIVALPDVPITAVRAAGDSVVVEHVLPPGQVIRLVERRAAEREGGAVAERSSELLARYVAGLRVEISGPFSPDSLSKLLERVRAIP